MGDYEALTLYSELHCLYNAHARFVYPSQVGEYCQTPKTWIEIAKEFLFTNFFKWEFGFVVRHYVISII